MPFVETVEPDAATGLLKQQYDLVRSVLGEHASLARAWSLQPEVAEAWLKLSNIAREKAGLDMRQYEILLTRVTYNCKCAYVTTNHAWLLWRQGGRSAEAVIDLIRDWRSAGLPAKEQAMLAFADKMCAASHKVVRTDVDGLRQGGFGEAEIVALIFLIGWLVTDAIVPNALGPEPDGFSAQFRRIADWQD
jgi:uncharacterized peroxidase-related enzyme